MEHALTAGPFTLAPPADWEVGPHVDGTDVVVLAPAPDHAEFRPNLVVNSEPFGGSAAKLSTVTLAGQQVTMSDYHLIDVDVWDGAVPDGRRFEYLHRQGQFLLHCIQFTAAVDGMAAHVTFTCAEQQLARWDGAILDCVDSIGVTP